MIDGQSSSDAQRPRKALRRSALSISERLRKWSGLVGRIWRSIRSQEPGRQARGFSCRLPSAPSCRWRGCFSSTPLSYTRNCLRPVAGQAAPVTMSLRPRSWCTPALPQYGSRTAANASIVREPKTGSAAFVRSTARSHLRNSKRDTSKTSLPRTDQPNRSTEPSTFERCSGRTRPTARASRAISAAARPSTRRMPESGKPWIQAKSSFIDQLPEALTDTCAGYPFRSFTHMPRSGSLSSSPPGIGVLIAQSAALDFGRNDIATVSKPQSEIEKIELGSRSPPIPWLGFSSGMGVPLGWVLQNPSQTSALSNVAYVQCATAARPTSTIR